jgi:hypothetical protein
MNNILKTIVIVVLLPVVLLSQKKEDKADTKAKKLSLLPESLKESSGAIFYGGKLWTHNDSGGLPEFSAVDPETGIETAKITISNATNKDWEDITQDSAFIYIADTGNNLGNRKEFQIYKIDKNTIDPDGGMQSVKAEIISFSHESQPDFSIPYFHDYDCEAIASIKGSLFIFSKNWASRTCNIYQIDTIQHKAVFKESFDSQGLITGAEYSTDDDRLLLCGYRYDLRVFKPFIIEIANYCSGNREFKKYHLPLANHQVEGICRDGNRILITNEESFGIDMDKYQASIFEIVTLK